MRCVRSVGYCSGASCTTVNEVNVRSAPTSNDGRSVLTLDVSSHCCAQPDRSRPDDFSSALSRSSSVVLPKACVLK
jgi:hypothetical protein